MKNNNVFCRLFLSFFFWPLHCQAYDLRLLIAPLISLNFCCNQTAKTRPLIYCAKLMFFISPSSFSVISWLSDLLQRGVLINNDLISETRALVYIYMESLFVVGISGRKSNIGTTRSLQNSVSVQFVHRLYDITWFGGSLKA